MINLLLKKTKTAILRLLHRRLCIIALSGDTDKAALEKLVTTATQRLASHGAISEVRREAICTVLLEPNFLLVSKADSDPRSLCSIQCECDSEQILEELKNINLD